MLAISYTTKTIEVITNKKIIEQPIIEKSSNIIISPEVKKIEFDEEADYPEDVDLIPAGGWSSGKKEPAKDEAADVSSEEKPRSAVSKKAAAPAPAAKEPAEDSYEIDDEEEFYADDDDDMEYSFLNSSTKRSSRKR